MEKRGCGFTKFLAGAAIGVGLGVLFAPKSGAETRKELKEKFDELVKKVKELDMKEVRDSFMERLEDIKTELSELDKEKVVAIAKEKAALLKEKMDDLFEEAKAKATPVVQNAVSEFRKKMIKVLKGTVKKIEAAEKNSKTDLKEV